MSKTINFGNHVLVSITDSEPHLFKLDDIVKYRRLNPAACDKESSQ